MNSTALLLGGTTGKLARELASATPQLLTIAKAANKLNPSLGDTTFLFDSLSRGIKRNSPLIIDNTGVIVDGEAANKKYAASIGKAVDALTEEEQKIALLNQVLERGSVLIDQAGGDTTALTDDFDRLGAAIANTVDNIKRDFFRALGDIPGAIADVIEELNEMDRNLHETTRGAELSTTAWEDYARKALEARKGQTFLSDVLIDVALSLIEQGKALDFVVARFGLTDKATFDAGMANIGFAGTIRTVRGELAKQRDEMVQTAAVFKDEFKASMEGLNIAIADPLGKLHESFKQSQMSMIEDAARLRDAITDLESRPQTAAGRQELLLLQGELNNTKTAILENARAHEEETKIALFGLLQQRIALMNLTADQQQAAFMMLNNVAHAWGIIGDQTFQTLQAIDMALTQSQGNFLAAQAEIIKIANLAQAAAGDYQIRFHVSVTATPGGNADIVAAHQANQQVTQAIDQFFPPGTFSGGSIPSISGGGGAVPKLPKIPKPKKDPIQEAFELGNALSQVGQTAATMFQELNVDPLLAQLEKIDQLMQPGHVDLLARERTTELEELRAKALANIAAAEEKILAFQKAQQQLQFLQQQVQLLDLIKEHKLDSAEILGGLEIGVDADLGAVLDAMTRAIQAIIEQTETDLGLSSPSKVYEKFGMQIDQGLALGIEAGTRMLTSAMSQVIEALTGETRVTLDSPTQGIDPIISRVQHDLMMEPPARATDEQSRTRLPERPPVIQAQAVGHDDILKGIQELARSIERLAGIKLPDQVPPEAPRPQRPTEIQTGITLPDIKLERPQAPAPPVEIPPVTISTGDILRGIQELTRSIDELAGMDMSRTFQMEMSLPRDILKGVPEQRRSVENMAEMVLPSSFTYPEELARRGGSTGPAHVEIHVHPSAGMDEAELARKVGEVYKRRIR